MGDIVVDYSTAYRSTGLGLRLARATENGIGALLVCSLLLTPPEIRFLPPFRYTLARIGNDDVLKLPFEEVVTRTTKKITYPIVRGVNG